MSVPESEKSSQTDWEVTPEGWYIATRDFLLRRGYCCANRCLRCPYINWREQPDWQHAPVDAIQRVRVSPKAIAGATLQLQRHEQALAEATSSAEQSAQLAAIAHYRLLLERWQSQALPPS